MAGNAVRASTARRASDARGRSDRSRLIEIGSILAVVCGLIAAYHELADFSPISPRSANRTDPIEGQLFVPNQKPVALIFALAAGFLALRGRALIRAIGSRPVPVWSGALVVMAAALNVWSHMVAAPHLTLVSLSFMTIGLAGLLAGSDGARLARLPALFPLLALPIPGFVLNGLVDAMQLWTARVTGWLLSGFGVEHVVQGELVHTGAYTFQVIEGCSGLRSTETLLMAAIVYVTLLPHSRICSWLVVASAPLIGLVVNQLRVLSIVFGPESWLAGSHATQGLVMIVVGVLVIDRVNTFLASRLPRAEVAEPVADRRPDAAVAWPTLRWGMAVALLCLTALATRIAPWETSRPEHVNPNRFPRPDRRLGRSRWTRSTASSSDRRSRRSRSHGPIAPTAAMPVKSRSSSRSIRGPTPG